MKIVVVGFGFMGVTHTFNILQNSNLQLVAIVDKNSEQVPEKLQENLGNFSTGSLSQSVYCKRESIFGFSRMSCR